MLHESLQADSEVARFLQESCRIYTREKIKSGCYVLEKKSKQLIVH